MLYVCVWNISPLLYALLPPAYVKVYVSPYALFFLDVHFIEGKVSSPVVVVVAVVVIVVTAVHGSGKDCV